MRSVIVALVLLPLGSAVAQAEVGLASFYSGIGNRGEMTCAHRSHPFGKRLRVSYGKASIECRVNDRGPFVRGRIIDVSTSAARALGMMGAGVVRVVVEPVIEVGPAVVRTVVQPAFKPRSPVGAANEITSIPDGAL